MDEITIVRAKESDATTLTQIAVTAKKHWGYPDDWIVRWADQLSVTPPYIAAHPVYACARHESIVGFYGLQCWEKDALLDHLWVLPSAMRGGLGRLLFQHASTVAKQQGARRMTIVGDPHAEGFYRRMGAIVYGREPAPMDDVVRFLPLLEILL